MQHNLLAFLLALLFFVQPALAQLEVDLEKAFKDQIIGGPGNFVLTADGKKKFAQVVRRKLVLEIAGRLSRKTKTRLAQTPQTREK